MAQRLAIYWSGGDLGIRQNPFGKDVANLELHRALARHGGLARLDVLTGNRLTDEQVTASLLGDRSSDTHVAAGSILDIKVAKEAGALLRGSADLGELAWLRRRFGGERQYSLIGLVHSLAPPAVREFIAAASVAPVHPWDALICTSPSVREALERMFDEWGDYLAGRFRGTRRHRPHLPLIPLGVDQPAFQALADRPVVRAATREELGLAADDVLVLWVGRLSFFEKAYPQPMFRAIEEAARSTGRRVHFALAGWFPRGEDDRRFFEGAARAYAPSTPVHFIDGNDRDRLGALWAASDVFLSLVDNVQETFGITPIEAMAAGLPVVASDWDGYRYTVRDGQEGFLIPTLIGPAGGLGPSMAARHALHIDPYQAYVGGIAQHTAVHVGRAAEALAALVRSPDLRRRMGDAGRARVRATFDWPVVAAQVIALVDELAAIRARAADSGAERQPNPVKGDPFRDFAGFATAALSPDTPVAVRPGVGAGDLERTRSVELDGTFAFWRGSPAECAEILALLTRGEAQTAGEVTARFPPGRRRQIELALVWMAKLGLLDWLGNDPQ